MDETEVNEYIQRAARLRSEGRLEESVEAAYKATTLGCDDANAWWQLALSLGTKYGPEPVRDALEWVTALAPHFAAGWCELGRVNHEDDRLYDAIAAYEEALGADGQHVDSMCGLACALKGLGDENSIRRRLELLRAVQHCHKLNRDDLFDLAYLLGGAQEHAESARTYEAYTREHGGQTAFFYLALAYRRLGRDADALDALETARRSGYQDDRLLKVSDDVRTKLRDLRQRVLKDTQPYLPQKDWHQHYVNPFSLLNVERPEEVFETRTALQVSQRALLQEIHLEEGKVDWMPGLVLDRSAAMAILNELKDDAAREAHRLVFEDKALADFLTSGHLAHFLIQDEEPEEVVLPYLLEPSILRVVGPKFAAQYNKVLSKAVGRGDVDVVECLLDGRRWVLPDQEDSCFEGTKRVLVGVCEPLVKLTRAADKRTVTRNEIESALSQGRLGQVLVHLPIEFHETHSAVGRALRELAMSYFNREHDATEALAILKLGKVCAEMSPALAHQFSVDEKALNDIIAEERTKEAHLTFGQKILSITKSGIVYGDQRMVPADVVGVRWGLAHAAELPNAIRHTLAFQNRRGPDIVVTWTTSNNLDAQRKHWESLVEATLNFVVADVVASLQRQLDDRAATRVGPVEVVKDGVIFDVTGWLSTQRVLAAWRNLESRIVNGALVLRDISNSKAVAEMALETTYNAIVLHMLASRKESASS